MNLTVRYWLPLDFRLSHDRLPDLCSRLDARPPSPALQVFPHSEHRPRDNSEIGDLMARPTDSPFHLVLDQVPDRMQCFKLSSRL